MVDHKKFDDIEMSSDSDDDTFAQKTSSNFKFLLPFILVIAATKVSYFLDREKSLNFQMNPQLEELRMILQTNKLVKDSMGYVGLVGLFLVENFYINRKFGISSTFASRFLSNILTVLLILNHFASSLTAGVNAEGTQVSLEQVAVLSMTYGELINHQITLTWLIFGMVVAVVVFILALNKYLSYYYKQS